MVCFRRVVIFGGFCLDLFIWGSVFVYGGFLVFILRFLVGIGGFCLVFRGCGLRVEGRGTV